MQIHQSAEDYLETILMLSQRMGKVRSIDVVNELGFTKASVSIAMKKLRENGYIAVDGEGNLTLLAPGREIAERIYGLFPAEPLLPHCPEPFPEMPADNFQAGRFPQLPQPDTCTSSAPDSCCCHKRSNIYLSFFLTSI